MYCRSLLPEAHKEELAAAGYEIIGVSKDKQALQKKFSEAKGLQFPSYC